MEPIRRVRVVATGDVQGVFFRDNTRREADRAGVTGWVRNRADGAVEAELQGPPNAVEELIAFVHGGPGRARVAQVEVDDIDVVDGETRFAIR